MIWADVDYGFKKKITIDHTKVAGDEVNFPVLISITDANLADTDNGGCVESSSGYDIVFYNDDEDTLLKHEIESYTNTDGTLVYWVKVNSLSSSSDTTIYAYYGKSSVTINPSSTDTWDDGFKTVYHMDDLTTSTIEDSTSNGYDGTKVGVNTPIEADERIGKGQEFDGITDYITTGLKWYDDFGNDLTVSGWFNGTTMIFGCRGRFAGGYSLIYVRNTATYFQIYIRGLVNLGEGYDIRTNSSYDDGEWHYFTAVISTTNPILYVDGVSDTTEHADGTTGGDLAHQDMIMGAYNDNTVYNVRYTGGLDEIRFSTTVRSADWVLTEYNTVSSPSLFMSFGEAKSAPATWYDTDYKYKKKITIDHTKVAGDEVDFPVLISTCSDADLADTSNGGHVESSNGYDIIFTNNCENTLLKHEIESYTNTDGTLVYWVKVDSLSSTVDTDIYMYYGDSTPTVVNPSSTDTWDSSFELVYHMKETSGHHEDSTSNGNDSTAESVTAQGSATGIADGADDFERVDDATGDSIRCPNVGSLNTFTTELWAKYESLANYEDVMGADVDKKCGIIAYADGHMLYILGDGASWGNSVSTGVGELVTDNWYYLTGTSDGTDIELFKNAVSKGTAANTYNLNAPIHLGERSTVKYHFDGIIDEFRISSVQRSNNWIETTYNTIDSPATFISFGSEAPLSLDYAPSDAANANDSASFDQCTHIISDDANAIDAMIPAVTVPFADNANASDSKTEGITIPLDDDANASDSSPVPSVMHPFSDDANASDSFAYKIKHFATDTAKAIDSLITAVTHPFSDIAHAIDLRIEEILHLCSDDANASDSYADDSLLPDYPCETFTLYGTSTNIHFPKPKWANPNNEISKSIDLFNFWSGDIETVDKGINTQSLSIGGTVFILDAKKVKWADLGEMTTWLDSIKTAMNNGEEFTINELGNCLNGVYVIKDFSFDTIVGTADAWSWSLSLERVRDV